MLQLKVARKLVIIESDLERTEERAELSERYDVSPFTLICTYTCTYAGIKTLKELEALKHKV